MSISYKKTVVVIPVYKQQPSKIELLSLAKCAGILKEYSLIFVAPKGLDLSIYYDQQIDFSVEWFDDRFFNGVSGYNQLLIAKEFYSRFTQYEYILIYQLDALIFKNTLHEWTEKNYDYIGAPWLEFPMIAFFSVAAHVSIRQAFKLLTHRKIKNPVGNGGLSLRKVSSALIAIDENKKVLSKWKGNEDYFWSYYATVNGQPFSKPSVQEALRFSIETKPQKALQRLDQELPFGAHDWESHDKAFWNRLLWDIKYFDNITVSIDKPKVSIITVAKTKSELSKTLDSIRENEYDNTELVVINSSPDLETLDLMKKNQDIISKWAKGSGNIYDDMNKGLQMSTGQYVWFVKNGEKIYSKNVLTRIFKEECHSDVYYGNSILKNGTNGSTVLNRIKSPTNLSWKTFPYNRSISPGALIAKRELVPLFDSNYIYSAEIDWQIKVLKKASIITYTGLILDVFADEEWNKIDLKDFLLERYQVVKENYGVARSLVNQTLAFSRFLGDYLKYGRYIMN